MSNYAVHTERGELLAIWGTGVGSIAHSVATNVDQDHGALLAAALTRLARAAWRTYTHPASSAGAHGPNTEGWRREQERRAFADALDALTSPNLPRDGYITQSYSPVTETAHQVGRALHQIGDDRLQAAVVADVTAELAAVDAAERGDLTGRARQAVTLTRADASPLQVAAADALLMKDPLGSDALFTEVEPTAAAIAATHWFLAAISVAVATANVEAKHVINIADGIQVVPLRTLFAVLDLAADATPRQLVLSLVNEAMAVADGYEPIALATRYDDEDGETRLSVLDPARPAHDLLEDLLTGIEACLIVHSEYSDDAGVDAVDDDEESAETDLALRDSHRAVFLDSLRTVAAADRGRIA